MRRPSLFLAAVLAWLLLGAQQAAFAHLVGHLGGQGSGGVDSIVQQDDEGHGEAPSLSHVCTTCVGLGALAGAAPAAVSPRLTFVGAFAAPVTPPPAARAEPALAAFRARAPPLPL